MDEMQAEKPISLDDEVVQARRREYFLVMNRTESRHGKIKVTMTFEELFEAFQSDCITLTRIGELNGVSRERIRQIYNLWFRDLFEGKSGRGRIKACTIVNRAVRREGLKHVGLDDPTTFHGFVSQKAISLGFAVERLPSDGNSNSSFLIPQHGRLLINSHIVGLRWVSKFRKIGGNHYGCVHVSRSRLFGEFAIVAYLEPKDEFYIIPTAPILAVMGRKEATILYILQKKALFPRRAPRINFFDHVNRWDLLR